MLNSEPLRLQLERGWDLNLIRQGMVDLIQQCLERSKAWQNSSALDNLTNALGVLTLNINASQQPNEVGLVLCLSEVDKAIIKLESDGLGYPLHRKKVQCATYDILMEALQTVREKLVYCASTDGQAPCPGVSHSQLPSHITHMEKTSLVEQ